MFRQTTNNKFNPKTNRTMKTTTTPNNAVKFTEVLTYVMFVGIICGLVIALIQSIIITF